MIISTPICPSCLQPLGTSLTYCHNCGWNMVNQILRVRENNESGCFHRNCPKCHGNGVTTDGEICVHMISCNCPRCSPRC